MFQTLWVLLAYSYNVILVLFIATHLFVGAIISFLVGMYIGVYLSQNYDIPRINEPRTLWEKFLAFLEKNRRDPEKISVANILQPSTIKELVVEDEVVSKKREEALPLNPEVLHKSVGTEITENRPLVDDQQKEEIEITEKGNKTDAEILQADFMTSNVTSDNPSLFLTDLDIEDLKLIEKYRDISSLDTLDS